MSTGREQKSMNKNKTGMTKLGPIDCKLNVYELHQKEFSIVEPAMRGLIFWRREGDKYHVKPTGSRSEKYLLTLPKIV